MSVQVPELILAGVSCFKIEGRLKGPDYVALTTQVRRVCVEDGYPHLVYDTGGGYRGEGRMVTTQVGVGEGGGEERRGGGGRGEGVAVAGRCVAPRCPLSVPWLALGWLLRVIAGERWGGGEYGLARPSGAGTDATIRLSNPHSPDAPLRKAVEAARDALTQL